MKDKDLPLDNDSLTLEELTDQANKILESLEKESDLNNSITSYQELLRLNNTIEKKFNKNFKSISEDARNKIRDIIKANEKKT